MEEMEKEMKEIEDLEKEIIEEENEELFWKKEINISFNNFNCYFIVSKTNVGETCSRMKPKVAQTHLTANVSSPQQAQKFKF
jgi:hypothetical protein